MSAEKSFAGSEEWLKRSLAVIPSATQTFSKGHTQFPRGASPLFIERGKGCRVWDVDGNEYIDYPLALGPVILGYGDPAVDRAIRAQLDKGAVFSLPHPLEVEVAEMIVERVPCAEMVRFGKNGSDATSAAVRLARAVTGRDRVACCGYHGWQDWYIGTTTRSRGVPKAVSSLTDTFVYNKPESLRALLEARPGEYAAVIMEPVGVEEPEPGFLETVAAAARSHGALLIFDEVVTGFRLARGGAQELYGVTPDLACFGKAMANGMPLSAVAGRKDVMEVFDDIFFSFTNGGEALSLAACKATLLELDRRNVFEHVRKTGERLAGGLNELAKSAGLAGRIVCAGPGAHTVVRFLNEKGEDSLELRSLFQQEAAARGVLFLVGHNVCAAVGEAEVRETLAAYEGVLATIRKAIDGEGLASALRGRVVRPVFRKP